MNNAQLMRELKESEEIKQVINHLTQDIIDLYHIQIPIQDIDEAVKMFGGRVEEDREKYCKYCDFISKERDSFAIYISPYYKSERRKMIIAQQLGHLFLHMGYQTNHDLWNHHIARRLLMPKQEFLDQIKKNEDVSGRVNLTNIARHFCVDESVVSSLGVDLNLLSIF